MAVAVEGDGDGGVPEELLDELRVNVLLEEERCARVPEIVKGYLGKTGAFEEQRE